MKIMFVYRLELLFLITILVSCSADKTDNHQLVKDGSLDVQDLTVSNAKIISVIREYISNNKGEPSRVYTMLVQRKNVTTTSFQMCSIARYSELQRLNPTGYFWLDDEIVLVYSGLECLSGRDEEFIRKLSALIGDRLGNDLLADRKTVDPAYQPPAFDPSTWEMTMTGDSVSVERGVLNLLGPPIVAPLKFIEPKKDGK